MNAAQCLDYIARYNDRSAYRWSTTELKTQAGGGEYGVKTRASAGGSPADNTNFPHFP